METVRVTFQIGDDINVIEATGSLAELLKGAKTAQDVVKVFASIADAKNKLHSARAYGDESNWSAENAWQLANQTGDAVRLKRDELLALETTPVIVIG